MTPRTTKWRISTPGAPERVIDVPVPVSPDAAAARERYDANDAAQRERYGFAPPSYTETQRRRDLDAERDVLQ